MEETQNTCLLKAAYCSRQALSNMQTDLASIPVVLAACQAPSGPVNQGTLRVGGLGPFPA